MVRGRFVGFVAVLTVAALVCASIVMAQAGGRQRGRRRFDPEQMRQRMMERMKEALRASDEEWELIAPRLEKVQTLTRQARGGDMRVLFAGMGGFRGTPARTRPREETAQQEQTPLEEATANLRAVLQDQEASDAQIQEALTAYREEREKVREELAEAQQDLREVLSLRQEGQLVLMGLLD